MLLKSYNRNNYNEEEEDKINVKEKNPINSGNQYTTPEKKNQNQKNFAIIFRAEWDVGVI